MLDNSRHRRPSLATRVVVRLARKFGLERQVLTGALLLGLALGK